MPIDRARRRIFLAASLFVVLAFIEGGAALTTRFLVSRGLMADRPSFTAQQIEDYFTHRDPVLGWTATFSDVESPCVSVYGDSFTAGSELASYPNELSRLLGCNVANFGVGGYGSDQALLLARHARATDHARVTIIAHVSENILRNLNQYRNLIYPDQELFFKPRFVLDGATLRLVSPPIEQREDFATLMQSPVSTLTHDAFVTRPQRRFPYSATLARWLFTDFHVRAQMARVPRHEPFYHADHRAGGLQLTTAILSRFAIEAANDGRTPIILLIPVGDDFKYVLRGNMWPDQPLADALVQSRAHVIHAGPKMLERLKGADPCSIYAPCNSHFNESGYRMLAEVIADDIRELVPPPQPARGSQ